MPLQQNAQRLLKVGPLSVFTLLLVLPAYSQGDKQTKKEHHDNAAEFLPSVKKSTECSVSGKNPDADCTPGAAMGISKTAVCTTSTKGRRNVDESMRKEVYASYGLSYPQPTGKYEVDHFIPLELGGSNDLSNLWPQLASPMPGFHQKDCVEDYLHAQVCKQGATMTLAEAQRQITTDWLKIYTDKAKGSGIGQCKKWGK